MCVKVLHKVETEYRCTNNQWCALIKTLHRPKPTNILNTRLKTNHSVCPIPLSLLPTHRRPCYKVVVLGLFHDLPHFGNESGDRMRVHVFFSRERNGWSSRGHLDWTGTCLKHATRESENTTEKERKGWVVWHFCCFECQAKTTARLPVRAL